MLNNTYHNLIWDSNFFGFPVFNLNCANCNIRELRFILEKINKANGRLVYWAVDPDDQISNEAAKKIHARLVDVKILLSLELSEQDGLLAGSHIEECRNPTVSELQDIESLALQSGRYSRFNMDPDIPDERFRILYQTWIRKSLTHEMADVVFIYREHDPITGFITLSRQNESGNIGLIAVDEKSRRKGIGFELIGEGRKYLWLKGKKSMFVTTQAGNKEALIFYAKAGFTKILVKNIYHIWL